ncbi:hypothetical protein MASR2M64_03420 [Candidatus Cloacimonadota bacterium]
MKRSIYYICLLVLLVLLGSCVEDNPLILPKESWLCSINADGTGFRKIKKVPFNTPGLADIYITNDEKIIFYGDRLWISDTDVVNPVQITPDNLTLFKLPTRISQSPDGSKLYFAADKNIYQLSYPDYQLTQLTNQSIRWLRNPIVSDLGNYLTYSSNGFGYPTKETEYLYCMNLQTGVSNIVPTEDSVVANGMYMEGSGYLYYEGNGFKRSRLDGSEITWIGPGSGLYPNAMVSFSYDLNYIVRWVYYPDSLIRCNDLADSTILNIQVHQGYSGPLGRLSKNSNRIFYITPGKTLCVYNLDTDTEQKLLVSTPNFIIDEFYMLSPTWDGSKVYFYCTFSEI